MGVFIIRNTGENDERLWIAEMIIESGICASGSLDRVMTGKHFNRALKSAQTGP